MYIHVYIYLYIYVNALNNKLQIQLNNELHLINAYSNIIWIKCDFITFVILLYANESWQNMIPDFQ